MKYVEFINQVVRNKVLEQKEILLFGQNITAGSCISGFTRGLHVKPPGRVINTPNCENTLCGIGFGCMMNGVSAIFFMKQQDFLLLGVDQLVNTHNIVRLKNPKASFTIMPVIVDSGYEGPQSALNNLSDFCSIAKIQGYTVNTKADAFAIIDKHLLAPGFRIIGISQRLFKTEIMDIEPVYINDDCSLSQYAAGEDATIVCFNLSFAYGHELYQRLLEKKMKVSLFSVNAAMPISWDKIISNTAVTRQLVIIDDSKSVNAPWQSLLNAVHSKSGVDKCIVIQRSFEGYYCRPHHDQLKIDYDRIVSDLAPLIQT